MKFTQSDKMKLKADALKWLRFHQRCPWIATEVGEWNADVFGCNAKKAIEIEIKISSADMRNELNKPKHHYYGARTDSVFGNKGGGRWVPNQFYFAVPDDLIEKAVEFSEKKFGGAYGVISLTEFKVHKRAKNLHDRLPDQRVMLTTSLRMGSELIRFWDAWL